MQAETTTEFSRWLRSRRKTLDLTRQELAHRVGCSPATIEKLEKGERRPSQQIAALLASCLQVPGDAVEDFVRFARGGPMPAALAAASRTSHIPSPPTSFVGRKSEIDAVAALLQSGQVRFVTLLGLAGIGKTRLSIEVSQRVENAFPGGVYFVALASISDPRDVLPEIAQVLGVREASYMGLPALIVARLAELPTLLVLDNYEHLLSSSSELGVLLSKAPLLSILVTSRTALGIYGEHIFDVPPMTLPLPENTEGYAGHIDPLYEYEAVALFVQRAKAANPNFELTEDNATAVTLLCRKLEGLPLAIELAANRVRVLPPSSILEHLGNRLDMLSDGAANLPPRQRSLRGALSWGYDLLRPEAQRLLCWLSAFAGGASLSAVEAIADAQGVPYLDLLSTLSLLIDSSMVRRAHSKTEAAGRFDMLETVREYATERLELSGEKAFVEHFHASFFLALTEQAEPYLEGGEQVSWLALLEAEHDNIRAAYNYYLHKGDAVSLARLAGALRRFWYLQGYLTEGRSWLTTALVGREKLDDGLLAKVLQGLGTLEWVVGRLAEAEVYYREGLDIMRRLGDTKGIANMLNNMGIVALPQGDYAAAKSFHDESLELYKELGNEWYVALAISNLGLVALSKGDFPEARELLQQSLAMRRESGDRHGIAQGLNNLGVVARCMSDYSESQALHNEALGIFRSLRDRWSEALAISNLAYAHLCSAIEAGTDEGFLLTGRYFVESWALFEKLGVRSGSVVCMEGLACVLTYRHKQAEAALFFGASERLREELGLRMASYNYAVYEASRGAAIALLGAQAFEQSRQKGYSIPVERVYAMLAPEININ